MHASPDKRVGVWLLVCAVLVWSMVALGGVTRLTRSGLSIVEWQPIAGALPPLSDAEFRQAFDAYAQSPEGRIVNAHIDLAEFRRIYLVEWAHRQLGRLTGLVVLVPLAYFLKTRRLRRGLVIRVALVFALGALQAAVGWLMVQSGLVDVPMVSPFRLMAHLVLALVIFAALLWLGLDELTAARAPSSTHTWHRPRTLLTLAVLLVTSSTAAVGALVAGMHAGTMYPTFPSMNGRYLPDEARLAWPELLTNPASVHFLHRLLALCLALLVTCACVVAIRHARSLRERRAGLLLATVVLMQVVLGAATVLLHVPIWLASLHQINAVAVLGSALVLLHAQARAGARPRCVRESPLRALPSGAPCRSPCP